MDISANVEVLAKELSDIALRALPQAISTSLNKTARTKRKEIKKDITKDTGLKQKEIAERLVLHKSNKHTLFAALRLQGR